MSEIKMHLNYDDGTRIVNSKFTNDIEFTSNNYKTTGHLRIERSCALRNEARDPNTIDSSPLHHPLHACYFAFMCAYLFILLLTGFTQGKDSHALLLKLLLLPVRMAQVALFFA